MLKKKLVIMLSLVIIGIGAFGRMSVMAGDSNGCPHYVGHYMVQPGPPVATFSDNHLTVDGMCQSVENVYPADIVCDACGLVLGHTYCHSIYHNNPKCDRYPNKDTWYEN